MKEVTVYTDGACSGNPGPGGWGAILIYGEHEKEISGGASETTNNRMELTAVVEALSRLKEPCSVTVYSDSAYIVNGINQKWLEKWKKNGWLTSQKKPVENQDLWKKLDELMQVHRVRFEKVKGHSDDERNNRCDRLAVQAAKRF
jgi:ribonuclease HI